MPSDAQDRRQEELGRTGHRYGMGKDSDGDGDGGGGFVLTMSLLWEHCGARFHPAPRCVRDLHLFCGPNSEKLVSNLAERKREIGSCRKRGS